MPVDELIFKTSGLIPRKDTLLTAKKIVRLATRYNRATMSMRLVLFLCFAVSLPGGAAPHPAGAAPKDAPSRPAIKGCAWEKISDRKIGLEAWIEPCDFGFRKIKLFFVKNSLSVQFSDGGGPDPLVDVLDLLPGEAPEAGVKRLFAERTEKSLAARCVLSPYRGEKPPAGVKRYTFVPNNAFQKELDAKADPNEVGDPPCGDWGDAPDGIQYFETQPKRGVGKVLFVRVGQDEPLYDEKTLKLLSAR